ncbi:methyl-accepting chemotaxis protein [Limisalsivibrio acetivorans]|uniref:methyl-accepting chemotaxis protein n=1 Tax=Limisalsivibrio acetivorans TaxID=1304888 RepID=UPI0003B6CA03|nr:methyl-accepting chemotaxis protein [Limisalsivibrio acetivorans]
MSLSRISIKWKLIVPVLLLIIIYSTVNTLFFNSSMTEVSRTNMKNEMVHISETIFGTVTNFMITGNMEGTEPLLEHMNQMMDIRMIRGKKMDGDYEPGAPEEYPQDEFERSVFETGKPQYKIEDINGQKYMTGLFPYLALKDYMGVNCFDCHYTGVEEGDVLGAVKLRLSTAETEDVIAASNKRAVFIAILGVAIITALIMAMFNFIFYKPFNKIRSAFNQVAQKDFRVNIDSRCDDEIGSLICSLNSLLEELSGSFKQMENVADSILGESAKLGTSLDESIDMAHKQSDRSNEVAAGANEMAQTSGEIANNVSVAADKSSRTSSLSQEGDSLVNTAVDKIKLTGTSAKELADLVYKLNSEVESIENIVHVINDIADNTNLLALNAAIEAARAGEHGRGFAVVADEVRKLAEKTADATKEVTNKINVIQQDSNRTEATMNQALETINETVDFMGDVNIKLSDIFNASEETKEQVNSIASAAEQQSAVSNQIAQDITEVDSLSKSSIDSAMHLKETYRQLNEMAEELRKVFKQYKL